MATTDYVTAYRAATLQGLAEAHTNKIEGRARLRTEIEAVLRDRLIDLELKESIAANEAIAAGASKTAVGRALGTANWQTIEAVLARTAGDIPTEARVIDPLDERYFFDTEGTTLKLQLDDETLTALIDAWEEDWDVWGAKHAGSDREAFTVTPRASDGRPRFTAVGANMMNGRWNLAQKWFEKNEDEAREYVEAKGWVNEK